MIAFSIVSLLFIAGCVEVRRAHQRQPLFGEQIRKVNMPSDLRQHTCGDFAKLGGVSQGMPLLHNGGDTL